MEDEIYLRDIFNILWKNRFLIIGIFMISVLVAGTISFAMSPVYEVSGTIALGNFNDTIYTDRESAKDIMQSDDFLLSAFEQLYPTVPENKFGEFKNSIKIENVKGTDNLLKISVDTPNTLEGKAIVEKIAGLYANISEDSYNERKKVLSDQLAVTQKMLIVLEKDINQTREALMNIGNQQVSSPTDSELRVSRLLGYLQNSESQHSSLLYRELNLKTQLTLLRNSEIILEVKEPLSPIGPKKTWNAAIAGLLGLMIGIFAAFLREGLRRPDR